MLRHKHIDRICCIVLASTLLLTCAFMGAAAGGLIEGGRRMGYEHRLFDQSQVHTIDIVMDDWEGFLETCTNEEYVSCSVVIDGEALGNVAIRAKGNTSLSSVRSYGNNRYSFKIEFDHYETGKTYHGLDKLSLNNLIQDATQMKDYLAYTLMNRMGAAAPLCSYAQVNVNGEPWGLYLAVEAVEDSFLSRNYGADHGELYKPDSMSMGGGRGNGRDFDMSAFEDMFSGESAEGGTDVRNSMGIRNGMNRGGFGRPDSPQTPPADAQESGQTDDFDPAQMPGRMGEGFDFSQTPGRPDSSQRTDGTFSENFGGRGSVDVMLQYTDDDPSSYRNIFESAKTDVSEADQTRLIEALRRLSQGESLEEKLAAVDAEAVIRYLAVHHFMDNGDSYTGSMIHNYYLYEEDGRLSMLPWDYNLAFGAFGMGGFGAGSSGATSSVNAPIDTPVTSGDISTRPILSWIFESEEYTALYHEIYQEFVDLCTDGGWLNTEIARVSDLIAPYVEADKNGFFTYDEFTKAIDTLKEYASLRVQSVAGQLDGSIPSTQEGQRADSSALIDASHLNLSDMGSMGMGGGFGSGRRDFSMPGGSMTLPEGFDPSAIPDGMNGQFPGGNMTPPGGFNSFGG